MHHIYMSLLGGLLVGVAAGTVLIANGRVAGVSGMVSSTLRPRAADNAWQITFLLGLVAGGALLTWIDPRGAAREPGRSALSHGGRGFDRRIRRAPFGRMHERPRPLRRRTPFGAVRGRHNHLHGRGRAHRLDHAARSGGALMPYAKHFVAFGAGMVFAVGLGISRLLLPSTIHGFLDITGRWDPTVAIVMGVGCATYFAFNLIAQRRAQPLVAEKFTLPKQQPIDWRLIVGAILFGVGWGAAGVCPGPAITGALWNTSILAFAGAVFAGVAIFEASKSWFTTATTAPSQPSASRPIA